MRINNKGQRITPLLGRCPMLFWFLGKSCQNSEPDEAEQSAPATVWGVLRKIFWSIPFREIGRPLRAVQGWTPVSSRVQLGRNEFHAHQMDRKRNVYSFIDTDIMSSWRIQFRNVVADSIRKELEDKGIILAREVRILYEKLDYYNIWNLI